ncbi:nSTAND1 domain-containing NTPase [Kitasatospora griseola]|uniref:nSTAND1 domain-containing NTPase n=1 Tax=Kitasatospora griseola TaxID=2064 RepID=UPI0037FED9F7
MDPEPEEPQVHLEAEVSGDARAFMAGRDLFAAERDLHLHLEDGVHQVRQVLSGQSGTECPYPGLTAFGPDESRWFFGRSPAVADLLVRLAGRLGSGGPQFVLGASGAGKSSLLRAGLLPALSRGGLPRGGAAHWPHLVLTPAARPLAEAARALAAAVGLDLAVAESLSADPAGLAAAVREAMDEASLERLVIVVDQLEELFTLTSDDAERRAFPELMAQLAEPGPGREPVALVVYGMRSDFYGRAMDHPRLRSALADQPVNLGPLPEQGLREAILFPARSAGLDVEPGLVELLLQDLGATADGEYEAGRLPLLAHALQATWQLRDGHLLTVRAYRATGGVLHAVAATAERVFGSLDDGGRRLARSLLLQLVELGDGTDDTRRRLPREHLIRESPDPQRAAVVLDAMVRGRLLSPQDDGVEITHEALLRAWPRLRTWLGEDREGLLLHQQLAEASDSWSQDGRRRRSLLRDPRLARIREWVRNPGRRADLTVQQREFVTASVRAALVRRAARTVGVVGLVLTVAVGVIAVQQHRTARQHEAELTSRRLATNAAAIRPTDPSVALELSLAAYRTSPTDEARNEMYASYASPYAVTLDGPSGKDHPGTVLSLSFSADGRVLASGDTDHRVTLWDVANPARPAFGAALTTEGTSAVAFAPNGRLLATHGRRSLQLWETTDPRHPKLLSSTPDETEVAYSLAFSPDGRTLVSGGDEGTARLWNVADPARPAPPRAFSADSQDITGVAFHPDGRTVATASNGGSVRLWSVASDQPTVLATLSVKSAWNLAFHPGGRLLVAAGTYGQLNYWDVTDPSRPLAKELALDSARGDFLALAFSADGKVLASANTDGSVNQFRIDRRPDPDTVDIELWNTLPGSGALRSLAFRPDNRTVAVGGDNGLVRIWTTPGAAIPQRLTGAAGSTSGTAFGNDGRTLVTGDQDGSVRLWDLTDRLRPIPGAALPRPWSRGAFLSDGRTLLTAPADNSSVGLWEVADAHHPVLRATLARSGSSAGRFPAVASAESNVLALNDPSAGAVHLWDITDRRRPREAATVAVPDTPAGIGLHQQGRALVVIDEKLDVRLWSLADPYHPDGPHPLPMEFHDAWAVASTPQHRMLVMEEDRDIQVLDVSEVRNPVRAGELPVAANAFGEFGGGRYVAAASNRERAVSFWDLDHPDAAVARVPLTDKAQDLAVSGDGRTVGLTTGGILISDKVLLWNVADPANVSVGSALTLPGSDLEFSPDSSMVATNVRDSLHGDSIRLWPLDADRMYRQICADIGTPVPDSRWTRYAGNHPYQRPCA